MNSASLQSIAEINPSPPPKNEIPQNEEVAFVPMASVLEDGSMSIAEYRQYADTNNGFTYFQNHDILFAKITPCFENNKIALAQIDRQHGFGSTEFHVIRPRRSALDPKYLSYFLRQDWIRFAGEKRMTGSAGQRRVPRAFLQELKIPLPPLEEQKRIAAILDQADALRKARHRAIERLNDLSQSIFYELFGDISTNSMGWEVSTIDSLCNLVRGSSPRPQGDPRYFGGSVPRLMIADITRDGMSVTPLIDSLTEEGARKSRLMPAGSVVMAVSGAAGLPAILSVDACIHDGFVGFRDLDPRISPSFLYNFLNFERDRNRSKGTGAIWVNLTTDIVKSLTVPVPPKALQDYFAQKLGGVADIESRQKEHMYALDKLFSSLQQRAFRGELGTVRQAELSYTGR